VLPAAAGERICLVTGGERGVGGTNYFILYALQPCCKRLWHDVSVCLSVCMCVCV